MTTSQNGYQVGRAHCGIYTVPGTRVQVAVREGAVATVLLYLAARIDNEVEDLDTARSYSEDPRPDVPGGGPSAVPDDYGFADRPIRGSVRISNHASGTAIDTNATQHPLGKRGTFTVPQVKAIRAILADLEDPTTGRCVVRWGGDYISRADEMHWEIDAPEDAVRRVAARIVKREKTMAQATIADTEWRRLCRKVPVLRNLNGTQPDELVWTLAGGLQNLDSKADANTKALKGIAAALAAQDAKIDALIAALSASKPAEVRKAIDQGVARLKTAVTEAVADLEVRLVVDTAD